MIKLILADDHGVVRAGIRSILERERDIRVVAEADDGWTALAAVEAHPGADVLVLDLVMPRLGGMEVLHRLRGRRARPAVLALSAYSERQVGSTLQARGAAGFVCKDRAVEELSTAVRAVASGRTYFANTPKVRFSQERSEPHATLSPRELQIFLLLLEERSVTTIASELGLTTSTISTHVGHIREKLGVEGIPGIVRYACDAGLVGSGALGVANHSGL